MLTSYVVQLLLGGHLDVPEVPFDLNETGVEAGQGIRRRAPFSQLTRILQKFITIALFIALFVMTHLRMNYYTTCSVITPVHSLETSRSSIYVGAIIHS